MSRVNWCGDPLCRCGPEGIDHPEAQKIGAALATRSRHNLSDLRVATCDAYDCQLQQRKHTRPATVDDLVAALIEEGAWVTMWDNGEEEPSRHLVFRLPSEG